jgi:hypothetical protein
MWYMIRGQQNITFTYMLVQNLNWFCQKASCSVPAASRNLLQDTTNTNRGVKQLKSRLLHWWSTNLKPIRHTHSTELTRLESNLAYAGFSGYIHIVQTLRRTYTRRMLQNNPANAITHRALTHAWILETKVWYGAGDPVAFSPLGKGCQRTQRQLRRYAEVYVV